MFTVLLLYGKSSNTLAELQYLDAILDAFDLKVINNPSRIRAINPFAVLPEVNYAQRALDDCLGF